MGDFSEFSERTDALAARLGLRIVDLPGILRVSEDMLMGYRSGRHRITAKAWRKLAAAESKVRAESESDSLGNFPRSGSEPTAEACVDHLRQYLRNVEGVPGAIGHTWVQLQLHFPHSQSVRVRDAQAETEAAEELARLKAAVEAQGGGQAQSTLRPLQAGSHRAS